MAFVDTNRKERFSLLLLEPGEIYFEDFAVFYYLPGLSEKEALQKRQKGRLKLCSKSLIFDPADVQFPILKFPLKDCKHVDKLDISLMSKLYNNIIVLKCEFVTEMLAQNIIAPYISKKHFATHKFQFIYGHVDDCLPQIHQLHRASTLLPAEQASMIATIVYSRQCRTSFSACWLDGLHEEIKFETQGNQITPLVTNPGRIVVTNLRLFFQPYNNEGSLKIKLEAIERIVKRRYLLQHCGLEFFCSEKSLLPNIMFSLNSTEARELLYQKILEQPAAATVDLTKPENMTLLWQNGIVSNYEYLLYLNSVADRSFNDLTQYPVFPWIIADYTSKTLDLANPLTYRDLRKPVGALNKERLNKLKERYKEMAEPKFLYGSHYSTPGFVLHYLVRKVPQYMLCLQNGRFDHPDRMFNSIAGTWRNVTTNSADFKELIPEFYNSENKGDFLLNLQDLDFGMRHSNVQVGDVELPPWASGPIDFLEKMRSALESDFVSNNLHHWIDLMFGYKQCGTEAEKADNVYYYLTYEGAIDLDKITDLNERYSLEIQITEFGQVPKQLFRYSHPRRCSNLNVKDIFSDDYDSTKSNIKTKEWKLDGSFEIYADYQLHKECVNAVRFSNDGRKLFSISQDNLLKIYSVEEKKQIQSINISNMALSSMVVLPDEKTIIVGSWDNYIYIYDVEFGKQVFNTIAHDDAISEIKWNDDILITCSTDSTIKIWKYDKRLSSKPLRLMNDLDFEVPVYCVAPNSTNTLLLVGTEDGQVLLLDMKTKSRISQQQVCDDSVRVVAFSLNDERFVCCGGSVIKMFDVSTSSEIFHKDTGEEIRCIKWDGTILIAGCSSGNLMVWNLNNSCLINSHKGHVGPILCVDVYDGHRVATGGKDKKVVVWDVL